MWRPVGLQPETQEVVHKLHVTPSHTGDKHICNFAKGRPTSS